MKGLLVSFSWSFGLSARSLRTFYAVLAGALAVAMVALVAPSQAVAGPGARAAGNPTIVGRFFASSVVPVTSSTGSKLNLSVSASQVVGSSDSTSTVDVNLASHSFGESHDWTFRVPAAAVSLASSPAVVSIPLSASGTNGTLKLNVVKSGAAHKVGCAASYSSDQKVAVSGHLLFNTQSSGSRRWGTVGSKTKTVTFKTGSVISTLYADNSADCATGTIRCVSGTSAYGFSSDFATSIFESSTGRRATVSAERSVSLGPGVSRKDLIIAKVRPPTRRTLTGGKTSFTIKAAAGGGASGSMTLVASGAGKKTTHSCTVKKHKKHQATTTWSTVTVRRPTTLSFNATIFGAIKATKVASASFAVVSGAS